MTRHTPSTILLLLASCGTLSFAGPSSGDHDRFVVQNMKIGMPMDGNAGFVCAKARDVTVLEDTHCVKFTDARCAGKPAAIGYKTYSDKPPLGCFLDYSSMASYLDGVLQQTANTGDITDTRPIKKPLTNVHIIGTRSKPSRIYRIYSMIAVDELTEDSKLYTAMRTKYGEPTRKNPPNQMKWKGDTTAMDASCDRAHCWIDVEDRAFEDAERQRQDKADAAARRQGASTPEL